MLGFKSFLESINIKDDSVEIDYSSPDGLLKTTMGKNKSKEPYVMTYKGYQIFSSYIKDSSALNTDIMNALKGKSTDLNIDPQVLSQFIKRTAIHLWLTSIKNKSIDMIVSIKSSSSLANDFASEFFSRIPNVYFLPDSAFKGGKENIKIDDKASEGQKKSITRAINKEGEFQIKKIDAKMRNLVHGYMSISDELQSKIEGKNILIVDDFLTSGATLKDIFDTVSKYNPKSIYGVTIFKARK